MNKCRKSQAICAGGKGAKSAGMCNFSREKPKITCYYNLLTIMRKIATKVTSLPGPRPGGSNERNRLQKPVSLA